MTSDPEFDPDDRAPLMIVISGPSGAGKDTIVHMLQERRRPFHFVVTATTREKRPEETEGKDYHFVSKEEFARMIGANELLEYAFVYGDYKGIPREQVRQALSTGKDVIMRLDVQGAETIRRLAKDALLIFVTVEDVEELERRLRARKTENPEELALRIATARSELKRVDAFDYVVENRDDQQEEAVDTIEAIITAEHHRVNPRKVDL